MKKLLYTTLSVLMLFSLSSCNDWLEINSNPDSPTTEYPTPAQYTAHIFYKFTEALEAADARSAYITQSITRKYTSSTNNNDLAISWRIQRSYATWCYQVWFVQTASSIVAMIDNAEKEGAWHYVGIGKLMKAWRFMMMLDIYGEMPYTEALQNYPTPKFDDGKTIFYGCLAEIDEAIGYFNRSQEPGATSLADGDWWNGGDVNKWIQTAYGFKARWLNNLSKKSFYDPDAVIAAANNGPKTIFEGTSIPYKHSKDNSNDSYQNRHHSWVSGTGVYISKFYYDMLANTFVGGSGVEDPRIDRLVPSAMFKNATTGVFEYKRTKPIDLTTNIRSGGRPYIFNVTYSLKDINGVAFPDGKPRNIWYNSGVKDLTEGKDDSLYVSVYSEYMGWVDSQDDDRYFGGNYYGAGGQHDPTGNPTAEDREEAMRWVMSTGTFYTRADAPIHIMCYPEMCFIKAEAYFRKGEKGLALQAYKDGIRAHMEMMNLKLQEYVSANDPATLVDPKVPGSPHKSKLPIPETEITAFLSSAAVAQTAGELTMRHIMQQKFLVMSCSHQNWTDLRRFNYSAGNIKDFGVVYPGMARPYESNPLSHDYFENNTDPNNVRYWPRRFPMSPIETNYNRPNAEAVNPEVMLDKVQSLPVWWDIEE